MNANVYGWCFGTDEGRTQFEIMLDNLDKALAVRYWLATQERPHYDHEAYEAAAKLTMHMFDMITGDSDISWRIDDLWLDSNSDIRYILGLYFVHMSSDARCRAEDDNEYKI